MSENLQNSEQEDVSKPVVIGPGDTGTAALATAGELRASLPKMGRAFNACINSDWAITEDGYRTVLSIAARLNDPQAVEAYRSKPLENTMRVQVRNGVAIIPITGPIFRYANLFTYYSGGTSVSQLAKDFRAALDDPSVYAILFEINSPGGEVTGINEFAKMVYAARTRKKPMPMTARVGGLMCSAALWIGVMAGDVVIDETAQVGSIGVCTTYMDDRKWMAKNGLEEIDIISEQSPYKNLPPTTDEGLNRVRARLSALCQVFGESVALGREVSIKTVWDKFGQGDVFVGQAAIKAGLADRFGSFEETLDALAKAHNPNYVAPSSYSLDDEEEEPVIDTDDDDDDYAGEKTLKDSPDAESGMSQETSADSAELQSQETTNEEILNEEVMSEENKNAGEQAGNKSDAPVIDAAEFERLKAENARLTAEAETAKAAEATAKAAEEAAKAEQAKTALQNRMSAIAKEIGGTDAEQAQQTTFLTDLASAVGEDSDVFKAYVTRQKAAVAQSESAEIFSEAGKTGASKDGEKTAEAKLDAMAKARAKADGSNYFTAYTAVINENPELYAQYEAGQ